MSSKKRVAELTTSELEIVWRCLPDGYKRQALETLDDFLLKPDGYDPALFRDVLKVLAPMLDIRTWGRMHAVCRLFNETLGALPPAFIIINESYTNNRQPPFDLMKKYFSIAWKRAYDECKGVANTWFITNKYEHVQSMRRKYYSFFGYIVSFPDGLMKRNCSGNIWGSIFQRDISCLFDRKEIKCWKEMSEMEKERANMLTAWFNTNKSRLEEYRKSQL